MKRKIYQLILIPLAYHFTKKLRILNSYTTIEHIKNNHCSISRFGDGEFNVIKGKDGVFQHHDPLLIQRLMEVIQSNIPNHLIGIPYTLKDTSRNNNFSKNYWEYFLVRNFRFLQSILSKEKTYYDSLITRFYYDYEDKSHCEQQLSMLRSIWDRRDILIVEGEYTRSGIGNDLFENSNSIKRILCPSKNAFSHYDDILKTVKQSADTNSLILISLGMAATVLAYDLAAIGFQAIDLGHLDIEYEWFRKGATNKASISGKYVNEADQNKQEPGSICDKSYENQIIAKVGI